MTGSSITIDFTRLLTLRLIVARHGEMDAARWWNTNGVLGRKGHLLMSRGFPKTHSFAQARLVFEVARVRCAERFSAPVGCVTLWSLPAEVEDGFDAHWADWINDADSWAGFFEANQTPTDDLLDALHTHELLTSGQAEQVSRLRRSAEDRAVLLSKDSVPLEDDTLTLLAAAFSRGEAGKPAIPYARVEDAAG